MRVSIGIEASATLCFDLDGQLAAVKLTWGELPYHFACFSLGPTLDDRTIYRYRPASPATTCTEQNPLPDRELS